MDVSNNKMIRTGLNTYLNANTLTKIKKTLEKTINTLKIILMPPHEATFNKGNKICQSAILPHVDRNIAISQDTETTENERLKRNEAQCFLLSSFITHVYLMILIF